MHSTINYRWLLSVMLMAAVLLSPTGEVAAADDYLSILEAEAADTGNTATPAAAPARKPLQPGKHLTPDLGFREFEEELRRRFAGTHLLYMKLSAADRRAAWKSYLDDNALASLRENIVALMSSG
jgi:hypothetical protein